MPLVFIHAGDSPYLAFTLRQARAADPDAQVVLLGDAQNDRFPFVDHVDGAAPPYRAAADEVAAVYRHLSTNRPAFELGCFERWFRLRTLFRERSLADALVLDSDVMLYATEAEVRASHVGAAPLALARPGGQGPWAWSASPHASFWTAAEVEAFCAFVLRSYTEADALERYRAKWRRHVEAGWPGGVCDMTALYLYAQDRDDVANLLAVRGGAAFDHNLSVPGNERPGEYAVEGGAKALVWEGGRPYGLPADGGEPVRFYGLHLQGHAKARIPALYRGPDFARATAVRRHLAVHYRARRLAGRALHPARALLRRVRGG